jgi:5-deoxy-5-amino-3-dehydroquinate synthase
MRVMSSIQEITVALGERSYPVHVGPGAVDLLAAVIPEGVRRAVVVTQSGIPLDLDPGCPHETVLMGDGEEAKSLGTIEDLCRRFAQNGLTRGDVVVSVGGGVVTDTAGFAAASYHRGVPVVHVATTLLAQVDAAIGGKTGVNIPEGKNLVGAFWQPAAVLCDTDVLRTLPPREMRCGLGEVAKYHFLTGDDLGALELADRVARCVAIKAEVVASDETESGRRAILNYGHTLGHALETAGGYDLMHGEAVAVGLVYAAHLAHRLHRIDADAVRRHREVVAGYDLPTTIPPGVEVDELVDLMHRDKKAVRGLTFALDGPRGVEVVEGVTDDDVRAALKEMP